MKLARAVFFVTDTSSAGHSPDKEFQMGKNGVDAALEVLHPASPPTSPPPPPPSSPQRGDAWVSSSGL